MKHKYLDITEISPGTFLLKVGVVVVQIDKKHLEILNVKIASSLNSNVIEDEELKGIFKRYEALQMSTSMFSVPYKKLKWNETCSKEKPVGGNYVADI